MLLLRIPMLHAFGLKCTSTIFTSPGSIRAAEKAGYKTIYETTYSEIAKHGHIFPGMTNEYVKSMSYFIEN